MAVINAEYLGELRTSILHEDSGTIILTDAPVDNRGLGRSFSPTDLVAAALGSCALSIMDFYAQTHNLDIKGARVDIVKEMTDKPRRIARIGLTFTMPANNFSDKDKKGFEIAAHACPVHKSLSAEMVQDFNFIWL